MGNIQCDECGRWFYLGHARCPKCGAENPECEPEAPDVNVDPDDSGDEDEEEEYECFNPRT